MEKRYMIGIVVLGMIAVIGAVLLSPYNPLNPPSADDSLSTEKGVASVIDANNRFAFELYNSMDREGNLFFSPFSISSAIAIAYEGANGKTKEEIKEVFHFPDALRENYAKTYNEINDMGMRTGNALWIIDNYPILDRYKSVVERFYGGKAANIELSNGKEIINSFISKQTNGKIKNIISRIEKNTAMIITNAIYFKGKWEYRFRKATKKDFYITKDNKVKVDMMYLPSEKLNYYEDNLEQVLELPYKNGVTMTIILPEDINHVNFDYKLRKRKIDKVYLPKFEFDKTYSLKGILEKMGMIEAFSQDADFSGMTGRKDLFISKIIHKSYIKVDEEGTEAAAATAVHTDSKCLSVPPPPLIFNADHPFIFIIKDKKGEIIFMGRVVDPR